MQSDSYHASGNEVQLFKHAYEQRLPVMLTGPTTLPATLNSLQMGFRTLALEQRSAEVWQILGAVKTEFARFGEVLEKTRKKLHEASQSIESAEVRTRAMARQLRAVESLDHGVPPPRVTGVTDCASPE